MQNGILHVPCVRGRPMPQILESYLQEDLFYQIRDNCARAKSYQILTDLVKRYNRENNWDGAFQVLEENHTLLEVFTSQVSAVVISVVSLMQLGHPIKQLQVRTMQFDLNRMAPLISAGNIPVAQAQYRSNDVYIPVAEYVDRKN